MNVHGAEVANRGGAWARGAELADRGGAWARGAELADRGGAWARGVPAAHHEPHRTRRARAPATGVREQFAPSRGRGGWERLAPSGPPCTRASAGAAVRAVRSVRAAGGPGEVRDCVAPRLERRDGDCSVGVSDAFLRETSEFKLYLNHFQL